MSFFLLLLACAPHHSSLAYKEPPTPKNQATVVFAIEDGNGAPIDLSSTYEEKQADWRDNNYRGTPVRPSSVTVRLTS